MEIKAVKIGVENGSYITVPYEAVSLLEFNGTDISECDVKQLDLPDFKIKFRFDINYFGDDAEYCNNWANGDWYGVMDVVLCFDNGTEVEITLPWKDNDTNFALEYNHYEITRHIENDVVIEVNKFNIYAYINSDAVGRHCQKLQYEFSPAECACLVNSGKRHTLAEKHKMFKHIADTMIDEMITTNSENGKGEVSLHETLRDYMRLQSRIINDFYRADDDCIYTCDVYYIRDCEVSEFGPYSNIRAAFDDIYSFDADNIIGTVAVHKIYMPDKKNVTVYFNYDKEPVGLSSERLTNEEFYLTERFNLIGFKCPTPFEKGDILYVPHMTRTEPLTPDLKPFVFDKLFFGKCGSSDMAAVGYVQAEDGQLCREHICDCLSFEYYYGKLEGKMRILKACSDFLKKKIPLDLMFNAYDVILQEERLRKTRCYVNFLEDDLKEIGL